jgi:hypothetical protein
MNDEGLKRPRRPVPVAEDYDGDDFEVDYFDSDQDERHSNESDNENLG